ncbi:putative ABC transport system permease protein [Micromonospora pattaloongensis]|uniref:Putative ABC transport system permease protein n=1 Tax=Micromonospora pattaloongensis TaxID=405436 RepID=A0A1H3K1W9_9ACTN|nr:hypothetical protein [Micromonospora pattaloongensis]SDY46163.1 putative ABC transport system permease protein [Micromonospora pattaloongensis]
MRATLHRIRAFGGHFAPIAALALVAALLITAVPRVANGLTDEGLRADVAARPDAIRDLRYDELTYPGQAGATRVGAGTDRLRDLHAAMPPAVRRLVGERWYAAQVGPRGLSATGRDLHPDVQRVEFGLRTVTGATEGARLVAGRWPRNPERPGGRLIEAVIAERVAAVLRLEAGNRFRLTPPAPGGAYVDVELVGIFAPIDPGAGIWQSLPPTLDPARSPSGEGPYEALALTDVAGLRTVEARWWQMAHSWHYRVDPSRLTAAELEPARSGLLRMQRETPRPARLSAPLDGALRDFAEQFRSGRALLAVVAAGVLATLAGLVALSAGLAARHRRPELALLRARGGALATVARRGAAESLLVVPLPAALGWLAGGLAPGRAADIGWLLPLAVALAVLAVPVTVLAVARRAEPGSERRDLVVARPSPRRLTAEGAVLVLAVLGAFLLRRRGLSASSGVDPYLVSVPVLLAAGAALLALRVYPWPLRQVGRLADRARGVVPFLGLARAGRAASAPLAPVTVLVVAIATAMFCAVVAAAIADGRDRATDRAVPADLLVRGEAFSAGTAAELARVPAVRAVAAMAIEPAQPLRPTAQAGGADLAAVTVLALDGPAFARVAADAGIDVALPAPLTGAGTAGEAVPALVSPAVAAELPGRGFTTLRDHRYEFRVAAVAATFPVIAPDVERFVVLPWQLLAPPAGQPLAPTGFLLAGAGADAAAVREVGDRGQREHARAGVLTAIAPPPTTTVVRWSDHRRGLEAGGINGLLSFGFGAGALGSVLLALLAIGFAVLAGSADRAQTRTRLRTLGLSRRQWRGLLCYELGPPMIVALGTGALVGAALPALLAPVLQLPRFAEGVPVGVRVDARMLGAVLALGALGLITAVLVETTANRRLRLGAGLRSEEGT